MINTEPSSEKECLVVEPVLPLPEPLLTQFAGRTVFTLSEAMNQRLTSTFWLSVPTEDSDIELENVSIFE